MKGFKKVKAYIKGKGIIVTDIAVENGKIYKIGDNLDITQPYPYNEGEIVVPGFIDQHIHGAGGADAMDGNFESLSIIANSLAKEGTTGFLATTMTQSPENISNALKAVKEYISSKPVTGAEILGVHLEGPFISSKFTGAQPLEYLAKADKKVFDGYYADSGNSIKEVTIAPEIENADQLIKHLSERNIVASAGHTDSGFKDIEKATNYGLKCVTHTFNAQKGVHHRDLGTAGAGLMLDDLYTEMICDLIHLSKPTIQFLIKNKPLDKIIAITDSMRAKYLPDGFSELGGQKVIVANGEARLENGALAGSILKMNVAIKNLVEICGVKLENAIDFATINPATNLGVADTKGSIALNKCADFALLDKNFNVTLTVRNGEIIHKA